MRQVVDRDGREIKEGGDEKKIGFTIYGCKLSKNKINKIKQVKETFRSLQATNMSTARTILDLL